MQTSWCDSKQKQQQQRSPVHLATWGKADELVQSTVKQGEKGVDAISELLSDPLCWCSEQPRESGRPKNMLCSYEKTLSRGVPQSDFSLKGPLWQLCGKQTVPSKNGINGTSVESSVTNQLRKEWLVIGWQWEKWSDLGYILKAGQTPSTDKLNKWFKWKIILTPRFLAKASWLTVTMRKLGRGWFLRWKGMKILDKLSLKCLSNFLMDVK